MLAPVVGQSLNWNTVVMATASGLGGFVAALALAFKVGVVSSDNPTTKTVHKRIDDLQNHIDSKFDSLDRRIDGTQKQFNRRFKRLDHRLEKMEEDIDQFNGHTSGEVRSDGYSSEWEKWRDETRGTFDDGPDDGPEFDG